MSPEPDERPGFVSADRLAELEEERRFLLRSIADLERERAAGDVDDDDYHALRDGYTARAAAVLRAIDEKRSGLPPKQPRNWKRLIGVTLAVVAFGVVAGVLVARATGQRDPSDSITGGTSPDQVASLLSEGKSLLAANDFGEASKRYLAALQIQPNNVEALTYAGWISAVATQGQADPEVTSTLLATSKKYIDQAIGLDPSYADPHCFQAVIDVVFLQDLTAAATDRTACVGNDPSAEMTALVAQYVDSALNPTAGTGDTVGTGDTTGDTVPTGTAATETSTAPTG
ncbi:MAG: hypothetical protein JWM34_3810 [Ilumatobacteraceae bacterium]|nr:hypothetical protein [Ilumatobacteraceae bacterium]